MVSLCWMVRLFGWLVIRLSVSEWFSDEELISQLQMFFDVDEVDKIDFKSLLGQVTVVDDDTRQIKVKGRVFQFSMMFCDVEEVL